MGDCELCRTASETGWWGRSGVTHCYECHRTWRAFRQQHCVACHRQFSTDSATEKHLSHGQCMSDRTLERRGLYKTRDQFGDLWRHKPPAEPRGTWQTGESGG